MKLELKNIHKSFGEKQVLKGISLYARAEKHSVCSAETEQEKQPLSEF